MTSKLGAASVEEVADLASFTSITQVVFAQMFDIDVSMISVSSVEVTSASAVLIAFSAAGSGMSISTISGRLNSNDRTVQRGIRESRYQLHRLFPERHR